MSELSYFPTPYPDESWYSVLCRYFVRSGYPKQQTVNQELFGREKAFVSLYYVNAGFYGVLKRLPKDLFQPEEILLSHTLFSYTARFVSPDLRQRMLDYLFKEESLSISGQIKQWEPEKPSLRYCPICAKEDWEKYGELYWHNSHQIQLMPLCPIHFCRLLPSVSKKETKQRLVAATRQNCPSNAADFRMQKWEKRLTRMSLSFLQDPIKPAESGRKAILDRLYDKGYLSPVTGKMMTDGLWEAMRGFYGKHYLTQIFSEKWFSTTIFRMLISRICAAPEKFAVLGAFLEIDPHCITSNKKAEVAQIETQFKELSRTEFMLSKKKVAEKLNVKAYQLDRLAKRFGVTPFWTQTAKGEYTMPGKHKTPQTFIKAYVTKEEKSAYTNRAQEIGVSSLSEYIKYCIHKEMAEKKMKK